MPLDSVVAVPDALEACFTGLGVGRQSRLNRRPAQRLAQEPLNLCVDLARPHRSFGSLEHTRHGLKHWAHLGGSRPRFTRIDRGPAEQLVVERAEPSKLKL